MLNAAGAAGTEAAGLFRRPLRTMAILPIYILSMAILSMAILTMPVGLFRRVFDVTQQTVLAVNDEVRRQD